jgi:hypothetical protein
MPEAIQQEIICYLPDKDEPIIVPAGMEDSIRRIYMGHPQELKVRIEPYTEGQAPKKAQPDVVENQIYKPTKKIGRPKKVAVN